MTGTDLETSDALRNRLVSLARDLILIPSTAARPEEIERCVGFVCNHLDTLPGVRIDIYRCDGHPSVVAMPQGVRAPSILLCGHLDVVEHGDPSCYRAKLADGRIIGPGAGDMKGQLAILLELFAQCCQRYADLSLGIAIASDEESGGMSGIRYLFEDLGFQCGEVLLPDGGAPDQIVVEEKGVLHVGLRAGGTTAHGAYPWLGDNPVYRLLEALRAIQQHFDSVDQDVQEHWFDTCAITRLATEDCSVNSIPTWAEATLDIRFTPPKSLKDVLAALERIVGEAIEIRVLLGGEPSHLNPSSMFLTLNEEMTGHPAQLVRASGGSDARFICRRGIPVVVSRPLVGDLHADSEWIDIASMEQYYRILERYIERRLLQ